MAQQGRVEINMHMLGYSPGQMWIRTEPGGCTCASRRTSSLTSCGVDDKRCHFVMEGSSWGKVGRLLDRSLVASMDAKYHQPSGGRILRRQALPQIGTANGLSNPRRVRRRCSSTWSRTIIDPATHGPARAKINKYALDLSGQLHDRISSGRLTADGSG